jgi:hypothetical protein
VRERLSAAQARHADLTRALGRAERADLGSWELLSPEQRHELANVAGSRPEELYRTALRTVSRVGDSGQRSLRWLRGLRLHTVVVFVTILLVLLAGAVVLAWGIPLVTRWVATVPAGAALLTLLGLLHRRTRDLAGRAGPAWQAALRLARAQQDRLRTAVDVTAAEVSELEAELRNLTAAGQLAGLVIDRAGSGDYRSRLGLMTQIREDFQRMATLLATAAHDETSDTLDQTADTGLTAGSDRAGDADAVGDQLPRIDRIVLYIDDLDRCPPHRVVQVLEAIHLLLAVDLFVVVVAVDPRWLLRAITAHYRDLLDIPADTPGGQNEQVDPDDEELWRSTPAQYLEKIFQVVLTLPPLDTNGYRQLVRTLLGTRADQPAPLPPTPDPCPPDLPITPERSDPATTVTSPVDTAGPGRSASDDNDLFGTHLPAARVVERVDPLTLDPDELALLDLLGPPHLIPTPRAVTRLANSYGLLTAIRRNHRADDLAEHANPGAPEAIYRPYRAGMVLLSALITYPALGPALLIHLHRTAATATPPTWTKFLDELQPCFDKITQRWSSPADPRMSTVQAEQWRALLHGLHYVTVTAAEHGLALPEPLTVWADWVVTVGRLSFPSGRIVNTLNRT